MRRSNPFIVLDLTVEITIAFDCLKSGQYQTSLYGDDVTEGKRSKVSSFINGGKKSHEIVELSISITVVQPGSAKKLLGDFLHEAQ